MHNTTLTTKTIWLLMDAMIKQIYQWSMLSWLSNVETDLTSGNYTKGILFIYLFIYFRCFSAPVFCQKSTVSVSYGHAVFFCDSIHGIYGTIL